MIEGQYLDINFESKKKIKVEDYLEMVQRKTAALIESSLQIGALLFLDPGKVEPFQKFGNLLGMAFQIEDDILGIWGNDVKTGKPSGNDIKKKKKSLPVVYFLNNSSQGKRELFEEIYESESISEKDFNRIMELLNDSDTRDFCNKTAQNYHKAAMEQLEKLPVKDGWYVQFKEVAEFLLKRDF
jgi:geranylgeranyl diphosphate synthase type I